MQKNSTNNSRIFFLKKIRKKSSIKKMFKQFTIRKTKIIFCWIFDLSRIKKGFFARLRWWLLRSKSCLNMKIYFTVLPMIYELRREGRIPSMINGLSRSLEAMEANFISINVFYTLCYLLQREEEENLLWLQSINLVNTKWWAIVDTELTIRATFRLLSSTIYFCVQLIFALTSTSTTWRDKLT